MDELAFFNTLAIQQINNMNKHRLWTACGRDTNGKRHRFKCQGFI